MEHSTGWPPPAPPEPGQQARRSPPLGIIILSGVAVLLLMAGGGLIYYSVAVQPALFHAQATATALARFQQTARANATVTAQVFATAQAAANATATAQAIATAQAAATATARQAIYTQATRGAPAFEDSLSGPNVNSWDAGTDSNGNSCAFTGGAYHISELQQKNSLFCLAEGSNFGNFAFQVQMAITGGDGGGIVFRASSTGVKDYAFLLYQDGTFDFIVSIDGSHSRSLRSGFSPIINAGLNRSNELTVVARGHTFYLYVNKHYLANADDSTYASGAIGLVASDLTKATDVAFQDAQVWTLS
ncbi:MAG: hypothetical protein NVSMB27_16450 [Ktedonobacteraceae bacterium]